MTRAVLLTALGALVLSAPARADWSRPASFAGTSEPVPRAAIASDGRSAVAFRTPAGLVVTTADASGRFAAPQVIDRTGARDYSIAAGAGGAVAVAWEDVDGVRLALRARSGRPFAVRRVATSTGSEINGIQIAPDPLGGWVIAERVFPRRASGVPYRVRALSLAAAGRPLGIPQELGNGQFGIDARPTNALAVDDRGRAVLTFKRESRFGDPVPVVVAVRPHGGSFGEPATVAPMGADARVAAGPFGRSLVAFTQVERCGDVGCFGAPAISRLGAGGAPQPPAGPVLDNPGRAFAPTAALTADGRATLAFLLKEAPAAFSNEAPVRAVAIERDGRVGQVQTLTARPATEPVALALSGSRVLVVWSGARGIGASLASPGGDFRPIRAPAGPPPSQGHSNATNRDARSAGRYAIVAWARNARVRISVQAL